MTVLAKQIRDRLTVRHFCVVFESDLDRFWPRKLPPAKRKDAIQKFAEEYGFLATIHDPGLRVIFRKAAQ